MKSEQINELAAALAKAQLEIENATKNASNPHFKNRYADLAAVLEECRKALPKHGLAMAQTLERCDTGMMVVTTLLHSSGQWLRGEVPLILQKQDMQGMGAAITYARRYAAAAMCGISQEDDDGNGAGADTGKSNSLNAQFGKVNAPMAAALNNVKSNEL